MDTTFRVRYQIGDPGDRHSVLFVEDREGTLYLYSGGRLQVRLNALNGWSRVRSYLERACYTCHPVDNDDLHPLEALSTLERSLRSRKPYDSSGHSAA